jgi:hypothetical protein
VVWDQGLWGVWDSPGPLGWAYRPVTRTFTVFE